MLPVADAAEQFSRVVVPVYIPTSNAGGTDHVLGSSVAALLSFGHGNDGAMV
jgi:hypothetical protein